MAGKLNARQVQTVSKPGRYADKLNNLYLQVHHSGTKSWIFRYMIDGRPRNMGLGAVPTFSLAEARERARLAKQQVVDGIDPIDARQQERNERRRERYVR